MCVGETGPHGGIPGRRLLLVIEGPGVHTVPRTDSRGSVCSRRSLFIDRYSVTVQRAPVLVSLETAGIPHRSLWRASCTEFSLLKPMSQTQHTPNQTCYPSSHFVLYSTSPGGTITPWSPKPEIRPLPGRTPFLSMLTCDQSPGFRKTLVKRCPFSSSFPFSC